MPIPPRPTPPSPPANDPIDVRAAFDILSSRMSSDPTASHEMCDPTNATLKERSAGQVLSLDPGEGGCRREVSENNVRKPGDFRFRCPCQQPAGGSTSCVLQDFPLEEGRFKAAGAATTNDNNVDAAMGASPLKNGDIEASKKKDEEKYAFLKSLTLESLIHHVTSAQNSRSLVYAEFNDAFVSCRRAAQFNGAKYVDLVSDVTVQFSVISKVIRFVKEEIESRVGSAVEKNDAEMRDQLKGVLAGLKSLQEHEKQKLQTTAAFHLAAVRLSEASDERDKSLLNDEIKELEELLGRLCDDISEDIEEVREGLLI